MANWQRRQTHLNSILKAYPRKIRLDAQELVRVFMARKSLRLRLADNYFCKLWEVSRSTTQRRLAQMENRGLIRRWTGPPRREEGKWKQVRYIFLVCQTGKQLNRLRKQSFKTEPAANSRKTPYSFQDYLAMRQDVKLEAFLFWMRRWNAKPSTFGYLRKVWQSIQHRADVLEAIIWAADDAKVEGRRRVGFIVSEIQART